MRWKPIIWSCIAFLTLVAVTGPVFLGTLQENNQLAYAVDVQAKEIDRLKQELDDSRGRLESEVDQRVEQARETLSTELVDTQQRLQELKSDIDDLRQRCSYEREMQANLDKATSRIAELEREVANKNGDQEVELRKQIAVLRTRHDQTEEKLDSLNASASADWNHLRTEVDKAWAELSPLIQSDGPYDTVAQAGNSADQTE